MNALILELLIVFVIGFGSSWKIQDWRIDAKERQNVIRLLDHEKELRSHDAARAQAVATAEIMATNREIAIRADADHSRNTANGLREHLAAITRETIADNCPGTERAVTVNELFANCADEYRTLAEKADRHVSDIKTLIEQFPVE